MSAHHRRKQPKRRKMHRRRRPSPKRRRKVLGPLVRTIARTLLPGARGDDLDELVDEGLERFRQLVRGGAR